MKKGLSSDPRRRLIALAMPLDNSGFHLCAAQILREIHGQGYAENYLREVAWRQGVEIIAGPVLLNEKCEVVA